jgi:hypothetical protein
LINSNRDDKCKAPDTDGFLSKSTHGIKQTLANAFLDQRNNPRERRQATEGIRIEILFLS